MLLLDSHHAQTQNCSTQIIVEPKHRDLPRLRRHLLSLSGQRRPAQPPDALVQAEISPESKGIPVECGLPKRGRVVWKEAKAPVWGKKTGGFAPET